MWWARHYGSKLRLKLNLVQDDGRSLQIGLTIFKNIFLLILRYLVSNYLITLFNSTSELKPSPYTVLARTSDHCPNFCEVLVNVILGVIVELMTAWKIR